MKKMIDQEKINKSDALFEGMTADANGNVTVGKNLEVDGTVTINTATDLKTKDGSSFGGGSGSGLMRVVVGENVDLSVYENLVSGKSEAAIYDKDTSNTKTYKAIIGGELKPSVGSDPEIYVNTYSHFSSGDSFDWKLQQTRYTVYIHENGKTNKNEKTQTILSYKKGSGKIYFFSAEYGSVITAYTLPDLNGSSTNRYLRSVNNETSWETLPIIKHNIQIGINTGAISIELELDNNTSITSVTLLNTALGSATQYPCSGAFKNGDNVCIAVSYNATTSKVKVFNGTAIEEIALMTAGTITLGTITDDITA